MSQTHKEKEALLRSAIWFTLLITTLSLFVYSLHTKCEEEKEEVE